VSRDETLLCSHGRVCGDECRKCEDEDGIQEVTAERDLLRRQVEAMANEMARTIPPEIYPNHYDEWLELLWAERVQWWVDWSLAKAMEGGG
jgi:hypothetical protein